MKIAAMSSDDLLEAILFWSRMEGVGLNESDTPSQLEAFLERNPGLSSVARHERELVGAVLCGHDGRRGYLHHLAVAPDFRNRGLGKALVESCLNGLRPMGILKCNIFVYDHNQEGTEFWRRNGWQDRGDLKIMQRLLHSH
jgi:N-acetylglutamate synthase